VSCTHGDLLETEQGKHVVASGCHSISEHCQELEGCFSGEVLTSGIKS
jgi:hypothetical protein